MKSTAEITAVLRAAGADSDVILAALELMDEQTGELRSEVARLQAADAARRAKKTKQKQDERIVSREVEETVARLSRDNNGDSGRDNEATVASEGPSSPPPKRYNQTPSTPPTISVEARAREWFDDVFYPIWPNKVGRQAAVRAAIALYRKRRGDMVAVIEGVHRYVRDKPADRPWLNPATFLNQERFNDQPAAPPARARAGPAKPFVDGVTSILSQFEARRDRADPTETDPSLRTSGAAYGGFRDDVPAPDERDRDRWAGPQLDLVAVRTDRR